MNQEKIGKFIAMCRKKKKMTQSELAEMLGVTDKSVGNWENGRNMPDLSLFKPLCDALDITINDLMSGEKISKDKYQEKFEENIVNTINYSNKKTSKYNFTISLLLVIFGLFIIISAIMIFPSESSWGSIYSVFGSMIFVIGISKLTRKIKLWKRLLIILMIFLGILGILFLTDYINVKRNNVAPMFRETTAYIGTDEGALLYYDTPFYDVIKCGDKFNVVKNKNYTHEELFDYCFLDNNFRALEYDCSFTKTYLVKNLWTVDTKEEIPGMSYVMLGQFQSEDIITAIIPTKLRDKLQEGKYYEFTYTLKGNDRVIETMEDINNYFLSNDSEFKIDIDAKETDKIGLEQIQESICSPK